MKLNAFKKVSGYLVFVDKIPAIRDASAINEVVYSIPGHATDVELIAEKDGYKRHFIKSEKSWYYVVDNIGAVYYDQDGTKHTINELGIEIPVGALLEEPPEPESTVEELAAAATAKRDSLISAETWRFERYASEERQGMETTDSIESLDAYVQALRDITKQEDFPTTIDWPTVP